MEEKGKDGNINNKENIETSQTENLQTGTNKQLASELDSKRFYLELTPEQIGTYRLGSFKIKNINPIDKSLELNGKVYQCRDGWEQEEGRGPNGLVYIDGRGEAFQIGEFQDGNLIRGFAHYDCFEAPILFEETSILYEAGEFENTGYLISGKRVRRDGPIEEGEFKNGLLSSGKRTYPDGNYMRLLIHGEKTYPDGTVEKGEFKDGTLSDGQRTYPDGKIEIVFCD